MTRRQWGTGIGASFIGALTAYVAAVLHGHSYPLLQAIFILAAELLVLVAIACVEFFASIDEDAAFSRGIVKRLKDQESRTGGLS